MVPPLPYQTMRFCKNAKLGHRLVSSIQRDPLPSRLCHFRFSILPSRPPPSYHQHSFRSFIPKVVPWVTRYHESATSLKHCAASIVVKKGERSVGLWLVGCSAWVFSMVVLGGITRLTRSGLSMTDWKFAGTFPPLSEEQWHLEFQKYQQSPEYKRVNKGMALDDFKFIYWIEYIHRMWGRGLGLFFVGPFAYFLAKKLITWNLGLRLSAFLAMGAGQGFVGWWMVKSGLEEPKSEYAQPRVSPYRLATHLLSAFIIYSGLYWTALSVLFPALLVENAKLIEGTSRLRRIAIPVAALVSLTAISGAFVAGNDAGHAFNTFPKMGDHWIPENLFEMHPLIRNFFENTATVQFDHRVLAITTVFGIGAMWLAARRLPLKQSVKSLTDAAFAMSILQVTLGISTLLNYVPVYLGVAHQAGALTLFTLMISVLYMLRQPQLASLKVPGRILPLIR